MLKIEQIMLNANFIMVDYRYGLSRLSPLLSGVLGVDKGKIRLTVTPEGSQIPAEAYKIRVEPLR